MFYSKPLLEQRIKEEKFRAYRTGSHFSAVFFNPFKLLNGGYKCRKRDVTLVLRLLDQETRETDVKGWWDRSTVVVILSDTSRENALLFIDKLVSKIQENGYGDAESIHEAPFKIISFPNRRANDFKDNQDNKRKEYSKNHSNQKDHNTTSLINVSDSDFLDKNGFKRHQEFIKRCLDIVLSVAGLIILSPFLLICAVLIKLDSPGPVFYRQTRVGKGGKCFTFLKFRSMKQNVDEEIHRNHVRNLMNGVAGLSSNGQFGENSYKLTKDNRVTRFGSFLRKTSIDELPQLINVLKGDMSLVGPRPHPVYEVQEYNLWHSHRLDIPSGITGLGQVYGRFNTGYEDVYRLDLRYAKKRSLILDLKILLKTIPVVLSRRGAQ